MKEWISEWMINCWILLHLTFTSFLRGRKSRGFYIYFTDKKYYIGCVVATGQGYLAGKHKNIGWNTVPFTTFQCSFHCISLFLAYYLLFHCLSPNEVHMNYVVSISKLTKKICTEFPLNKLLDIMGHLIIYKIIIINEGM